jgi:hypothetical protein
MRSGWLMSEHRATSPAAARDTTVAAARYPSLFQVNTRVWLTDLARRLGRRATLDDIPDEELDRWAGHGFDWIWLLSVWRTGAAAQKISRTNPEWRHEFQETLPDLREEDIAGPGFAITGYTVHPDLGGDSALARIRQRLNDRGLRLMLDFVPNHTAPDHPWLEEHPEYYVAGTESDLAQQPQNYTRVRSRQGGDRVVAFGRDPYFAGWPDTLQLDYRNPLTQAAMRSELLRIAGQCDGVRCDMAMLVLPDVFERTWGRRAPFFWPDAIASVRERIPAFCFMAEVYWDLEWTMQQHGFNYAYDKRLYERLRDGHARAAREHLFAGLDYQDKLSRFMENHDEPRAAVTFSPPMHEAAAIVTYLTPGLRFFHHGQFEGRRKRISPHLVRAPLESTDEGLRRFYERLLAVLVDATEDVPLSGPGARVARRQAADVQMHLGRGARGGEGRRHRSPRQPPHAAPFVRDALARSRRGPAHHPGAAGARGSHAHHRLSPPVAASSPGRAQSPGATARARTRGPPTVAVEAEAEWGMRRPAVEVADILHAQGDTFVEQHPWLSVQQ